MDPGAVIDSVRLLLPPSYRGASRDQFITRGSFNFEDLLSGEAYAYQYCKTFVGWGGRLEKPHDFEPLVYLGAVLVAEMFLTDDWMTVWPARRRPFATEKNHYERKFLGMPRDTVMVVDRYGDLYKLKPGESVEPADWVVKPLTILVKPQDD